MSPSTGNAYDARAHSEFDANGGQTINVTCSRDIAKPFTRELRLVAVKPQINCPLA